MTEKLTIIIPTLNREEQFPDAINSALESDNSCNVLVSANASNDDTLEKISVISTPRLAIKTWKTRLQIGDHWSSVIKNEINSDYYTIVPDDDRITDKDYYRETIRILDNLGHVGMAFADPRFSGILKKIDAVKIQDDYYFIGPETIKKIIRADLEDVLDICFTQYTTIFKTREALKAGLYPNCHSPDLILALKVSVNAGALICTRSVGKYSWNDNGLSLRPNIGMLIQDLHEIQKLQASDIFAEDFGPLYSRLIVRAHRALIVALVKSLVAKSPTPAYDLIKTVGVWRSMKTAASFLLRLISKRWPRLEHN